MLVLAARCPYQTSPESRGTSDCTASHSLPVLTQPRLSSNSSHRAHSAILRHVPNDYAACAVLVRNPPAIHRMHASVSTALLLGRYVLVRLGSESGSHATTHGSAVGSRYVPNRNRAEPWPDRTATSLAGSTTARRAPRLQVVSGQETVPPHPGTAESLLLVRQDLLGEP